MLSISPCNITTSLTHMTNTRLCTPNILTHCHWVVHVMPWLSRQGHVGQAIIVTITVKLWTFGLWTLHYRYRMLLWEFKQKK